MLQAQDVSEVNRTMSQGNKTGLVVEIGDIDEDLVEKLWKKFVKDYDGKTKYDRRSGEHFTDDAEIPNISNDVLDLYAVFTKMSDGAEVCLFIDLGGAYLNSAYHGDKYTEGEKFLMLFVKEVEKEKVKLELAAEEKALKELENELKRLKRANDNLHKEIEDAKAKIAKAEAGITENEKAQSDSNTKIAEQKAKIKAVEKKLGDY